MAKSSDLTPPRGQKSLTSFFGAARSSKTGEVIPSGKVQTGIKAAFRRGERDATKIAGGNSSKDSATTAKRTTAKEKENLSNATVSKTSGVHQVKAEANGESKPDKASKISADAKSIEKVVKSETVEKNVAEEDTELMDTDDDMELEHKPIKSSPKLVDKSKRSKVITSKKRVIEDDSDSDDDEILASLGGDEEKIDKEGEQEKGEEESEEGCEDDETVSMDDDDDLSAEELESEAKEKGEKSFKSNSNKTVPKSKKQKTLEGKTVSQSKLKSNNIGTKSATTAKGMKSNDQLLSFISNQISSDDAWKEGKTLPYSALCDVFSAIEAISSRLEIQEKLTELFRLVLLRDGGGANEDALKNKNRDKNDKAVRKDDRQSDLYSLIYLASNSVAPSYECVELGVGDSILIKAIGEASGTAPNIIKKKYDAEGDLGTVAQTSKGKQKTLVGFGRMSGPKRLEANEVLTVFRQIATTSGSQSQKWKVDKIKGLLVRARGSEPKYIIRGLQGKLRIGLAQSTVLASLAHAVVLTKPKDVVQLTDEQLKEIKDTEDGDRGAYPDFARKLCDKNLPLDIKLDAAVAIIKKAYSEVPSYDSLLDAVLCVPLQELHKACNLTPGIPVAPMLAKPTKSVVDVLKRLNGLRFTCEYKYDGERAQVHMTPDGKTKVFSRSLLNTSEKFPEVPLYVREACKDAPVTSFVLDTEVVAFNRETNQFVPFQVLSTRKRTEESAESAKVQVIVQAFDLMYLNGKSLLDCPLAKRRALLRENFVPIDGKFQFATSLDHTENGDTTVIEEFLEQAVKGQCEGLMVKTLDVSAAYKPSLRSLNWLKLKKDYLEGLGDSVDLVPLGAYFGKGKRTGVYGAYLLACYDEDSEEFQSVCKIGTGFSEEDLKELAASLNSYIIPEKSSQYVVSDALECDVWFDAVQVWEVKAADLSKSSTHRGAIGKTGESGRGIGLRFPRFERVRPDKKPEEATTSDQILDMYYAQDSIVGGVDGGADDDDGI
eukprot:CCRYP_004825-RA/>CCRYP_004825-RA protein AED:0.05 eAED:0.05 QI:141/1/1/1/0.75/0.8/5/558/998